MYMRKRMSKQMEGNNMKNFSNYTDFDTKENLHFESKAVHGALGTEPLTGAVSMPIFQAATFRHPELGESTGFAYSRLENPTRQELERTMAILEGGIKGFAFSSGQAANMAVFSLLNPGEHVILSDDIYGGTFRIIGDVFGKYGIEHTYVADIVTHSSTKYLGGHNDTISGIVVIKDNEEIADQIHIHMKSHGSQLAPLDSWLVLRGIKTLAVRMDRHNENAMKVAEWLRTQPKVKKVYYVGFADHKDYEVTRKQTTGFGGMISFTVDSFETVKKILKGVDMIMFAESLGGTETLITYPTTQTHEDTPADIKEKLGITDCFLRMSVGIENVEDIIADLDRAMNG